MKYAYYISLTIFFVLMLSITIRQISFVNSLKNQQSEESYTAFVFASLLPYAPDSNLVSNTKLSEDFLQEFENLLKSKQQCETQCIQNYWQDTTFNQSDLSDYYFHKFSPQLIAAFTNKSSVLESELEVQNDISIYKISMNVMDTPIKLSFNVEEKNDEIWLQKSRGIKEMVELLCPQ